MTRALTIQRQMLFWVFLINFVLFVVESLTGIFARSMGLVADSLDMFADAVVYGLSYFAVGQIARTKRRIARASGFIQLALALFGFAEVVRRFAGREEMPGFGMMIGISLIALAGNVASMYLLKKSKSREVHIEAAMIFTNNDILANSGVIVAGVLVFLTGSKYPDLVIASLVFALVTKGALKILRVSRGQIS